MSRGQISGSPQASTTDLTEGFLNEATASLQVGLGGREAAPPLPTRRSDPLLVPSRQPSTLTSRPPLFSARSFDKSNQSPSPLRSSRTTTRSSDSYVPQLTVDSLANAMVASSLASSRVPSPSKPPPLPHLVAIANHTPYFTIITAKSRYLARQVLQRV